ncbi:MATE family efflux transporter [Rhizobiaceae bacterium BDR2-2]|uniref:Multidrug-efflux transporter n=1 Tax=Ectorhizobium quercum TaxID=2965071 RepID=A0AAE3MY94_9HYPH|nr:MATE family efflux transporter [Ectorhizobium quercum]MCX8996537.1 MATE family efflux transporter [Ectorhizobium quercum]
MQDLVRKSAVLPENSWWSHIRGTLSIGIPLVGAQLAQLGIHTTDVIIIGQLGAQSLAAIVLAGQFLFTIFIFGTGFSMAVVPMVAQAYGRGEVTAVRRSLRMGLWVAIGYWIAMQPALLNAEAILIRLGQQPETAALAGRYVAIAEFGLLPGLLFIALRSMVSAINRAAVVLWATIFMLVTNAVLAYGLVLGHFGLPALGMDGAAFVAVFVQFAGLAVLVVYIQGRAETRAYQVFVRFWRPDWQALKEVIRLGLPICITILAEVSLFSASSLMMGALGTVELAAHGIALQLASITFMIPLGLGQGATVRIGVAHGKGDFTGVRRAAITVVILAAIVSITGGLAFALIPEKFAALFLNPETPNAGAVLAYAGPLIVTAGLFQLCDGQQAIFASLLRGLKDARVPMLLALVAYWPIGFFTAWLLAFPLGFGGIGVWFGIVFGLLAASIMLCIRFVLLLKREKLALDPGGIGQEAVHAR